MVFQGVLLAYVLASPNNKPYVEFIICCCGVAVSWFQLNMSAGSKYWQEYWEKKVDRIEDKLNKHSSLEKDEFIRLFKHGDEEFHKQLQNDISQDSSYGGFLKYIVLKKHSVSRQPIYTALALLIVWGLLCLQTINWNVVNGLHISQLIDGFYYQPSQQDDTKNSP